MKSFVLMFMITFLSQDSVEEIYVGGNFLWKVYYDPNKLEPVIEIGGVKYGYLDRLTSSDEMLGKSKVGELYTKKGNLFYRNTELKINTKLKRQNYSSNIDFQRYKIYEINASCEISILRDSLKAVSYKFNWMQMEEDYKFYRDNDSVPEGYIPNYIKEFYNSLKND